MVPTADIESLPTQPGVYIFYAGKIPIYIGKSVNIKTRVKSHIAQAKLSHKERAIVEQADRVEHITTLSNFDALILEADLIGTHKPRYNVVWKDDKNYLYIKITIKDEFPKIFPVRKEQDKKSKYFGPFRSTDMTNTLIYELRQIVPFCTAPKLSKRPCFYSRIHLCNPCPNKIENIEDPILKAQLTKEYNANISKVIKILSGKTNSYISTLEKKLYTLIDEEKFEDAIPIRNKLLKFNMFLERRSFNTQFTGDQLNYAELKEQFARLLKQQYNYTLSNTYRIECYDISNLYGKEATGSMVVYQDEEFARKEYRKFSVKYQNISDIYMMKEVLQRRLTHNEWRTPDLIMLDGGKPQIRMIHNLFRELNVSIPLISIAKRPDRLITPNNNFRTIYIDRNSILFKLFQSLRDESHRFAKKYHVHLRNRNLLQ